MNETPDFSIRKAIKNSRDIKVKSIEEGLSIKGRFDNNQIKINEQVDKILAKLLLDNAQWIQEQLIKIVPGSYLSSLKRPEIMEAFRTGLKSFFHQQYLLFTEDQKTKGR